MQPTLSLTYSSSDGSSTVGKGFALTGLSIISRCPRTPAVDGHRAAVAYSDTDAFCLDGSRLIHVGTSVDGRALYRTENYSHLRVLASPGENGPSLFEVNDPQGGTRFFGEVSHYADGRIDTELTVSAWRVSREIDVHGNSVEYYYNQPKYPSPGPRGAIGESNIQEIRYTDHQDTGLWSGYRITFEYEPEPDHRTGFVAGLSYQGTERISDVTVHHGSSLVGSYDFAYSNESPTAASRLASLRRCVDGPPVAASTIDDEGLVCLNPTTFEWTKGNEDEPRTWHSSGWYVSQPQRFLRNEVGQVFQSPESAPVVALDANGDGAEDFLYLSKVPLAVDPSPDVFETEVYVHFGRIEGEPLVDYVQVTHVSDALLDASVNPVGSKLHVADIDGDGRDEVVTLVPYTGPDGVKRTSVRYLSIADDGTATIEASPGPTTGGLVEDGSPLYVVGAYEPSASHVYLGGHHFVHEGSSRMSLDEVLDINGDGLQDVVTCEYKVGEECVIAGNYDGASGSPVGTLATAILPVCNGEWVVREGNGDGFDAPVYTGLTANCAFQQLGVGSTQVVDVTSDGIADVFYPGVEIGYIGSFGSGSWTFPHTEYDVLTYDHDSESYVVRSTGVNWWHDVRAMPIDANGDGVVDIVAQRALGTLADAGPTAFWTHERIARTRAMFYAGFGDGTFDVPTTVGEAPVLTAADLEETWWWGRTMSRSYFTHCAGSGPCIEEERRFANAPLAMVGADMNGDSRGDLLVPTATTDLPTVVGSTGSARSTWELPTMSLFTSSGFQFERSDIGVPMRVLERQDDHGVSIFLNRRHVVSADVNGDGTLDTVAYRQST